MKMKMARYDNDDGWVDGIGFSVGVWIGWDGRSKTDSLFVYWKLIRLSWF
jgi:hypothetical protein